MWVVDGNNVMGAGADGWWKDPTSAAVRIAEAVARWSSEQRDEVILVFDGTPEDRLTQLTGGRLTIDFARRPGRDAADDQIVRIVEERFAQNASMHIVTSDRGLADRLPPGVTVMGAGRFRGEIGLPRHGRPR